MNWLKATVLVLLLGAFNGPNSFGQEDLLDMLEEEESIEMKDSIIPVEHSFKTSKTISAHTTAMVKKNALDFRIAHRFGNMGTGLGGGIHNLYGFDNVSDVRMSFDYGITENLQVGIARNKVNELYELNGKWRFLRQSTNNKIPVTVAYFVSAGATGVKNFDIPGKGTKYFTDFSSRLSYVHQLIIARKFSEAISFEVLPTVIHRNAVETHNYGQDENTFFALGFAGRVRVSRRVAIIADYFLDFSKFRDGAPYVGPGGNDVLFSDPLGIGVEIETGGHVFHITLTNARGLSENNYLPQTTEAWADGGMKLGFNISRVFQF